MALTVSYCPPWPVLIGLPCLLHRVGKHRCSTLYHFPVLFLLSSLLPFSEASSAPCIFAPVKYHRFSLALLFSWEVPTPAREMACIPMKTLGSFQVYYGIHSISATHYLRSQHVCSMCPCFSHWTHFLSKTKRKRVSF